jgi:hypothetical protein
VEGASKADANGMPREDVRHSTAEEAMKELVKAAI